MVNLFDNALDIPPTHRKSCRIEEQRIHSAIRFAQILASELFSIALGRAMPLRFFHLPAEVVTLCADHLFLWERINMSRACRSLRHVLSGIEYGALEQVRNKHYTNLQLIDQYNEWTELKRMRAEGQSVMYAPSRFTQFVRSENRIKRRYSLYAD